MLLDTNALLWLYESNARLGPKSLALITEASRVYFSSISVVEIAIKHMLGRVDLPGDQAFPAPLTRMGLLELPFTADHAAALLQFPTLVRHDPFDRMLVGQAGAERMPLMTSDRTLLALGESWILDAHA